MRGIAQHGDPGADRNRIAALQVLERAVAYKTQRVKIAQDKMVDAASAEAPKESGRSSKIGRALRYVGRAQKSASGVTPDLQKLIDSNKMRMAELCAAQRRMQSAQVPVLIELRPQRCTIARRPRSHRRARRNTSRSASTTSSDGSPPPSSPRGSTSLIGGGQ